MSFQSMDFGQMQAAYAAFQQKYNQMISELDTLQGDLDNKLAQWTDDSKDAYVDAKRQWNESAQEIGKVMQALGQVINSSAETGQGTIKSNLNVISG